ncbi:hypothetical protein EBB54_12605 [Schaedlerella arabinosiphila]|uniref:Uncharacterized protein n=1 Tax=Schaedlerella arabinosiphila TaxID=2044587 RepID=A0A426DHC8_9FIRM|nr:hypothetical protein [Schaedlerella arabinosiphila]RRK32118.1 hypothetical protein EBB54_12605 [Schaedlerella arabinosiphila]
MMKLIREDLSMLPAWVGLNERTVSFFEWLTDGEAAPWKCGDAFLIKVRQRKDYFLYIGCGKGNVLEIGENLIFVGMFRWKDCGLYDIKEPLRKLLRIPDEFDFPGKADARKEAGEIANRKAFLLITRDWDAILQEARREKKQMIPKITRSEIQKQAKEYDQAGKTEEEIRFQPEVPVSQYFSDHCYLLFLDNKEWVAERIARQWVLENAAYISRQRTWYGCIRNEFREIKKAAERRKQ